LAFTLIALWSLASLNPALTSVSLLAFSIASFFAVFVAFAIAVLSPFEILILLAVEINL
jgi:hypothetical protein